MANDLLTPTLELRRHQLLRKYGAAIEKLYAVMRQRQQGGGGDGRAAGREGAGGQAGQGREAAGAGGNDGGR